ncbi:MULTISPECIES: hypothetical protein [Nocardiopsis]|uniref:hypothetical protein n=1 Tax=Nocardiopsis TaxID=2013 RepID=UPI0003452F64|nr:MULTISPECIES: hypothetical protein [Nocardiopsis]
MAKKKNARSRTAPPPAETAESEQLSRLAEALAKYGVGTRVIRREPPVLRVSNPDSEYAVEDVGCERREHGHAFLASFGVHLGTSESIPLTARKVAWLVGATDR